MVYHPRATSLLALTLLLVVARLPLVYRKGPKTCGWWWRGGLIPLVLFPHYTIILLLYYFKHNHKQCRGIPRNGEKYTQNQINDLQNAETAVSLMCYYLAIPK